jgi:hypothetical protein
MNTTIQIITDVVVLDRVPGVIVRASDKVAVRTR